MCLPADDQAIARVRPVLEAALRRSGWDDGSRFDVQLATCEALTNAVRHGSVGRSSVGVVISVSPASARVTVVDRGPGFPADVAWPPVCPDMSETHGRGLLLIAALSDRAEVGPAGRGTRVTMEFDRARRPLDA